jgi:hypothetical protein
MSRFLHVCGISWRFVFKDTKKAQHPFGGLLWHLLSDINNLLTNKGIEKYVYCCISNKEQFLNSLFC